MKKILTISTLLLTTSAAQAQSGYYPLSDKGTFEEMVRSVVILALIYLVTSFILCMIKLFLDNRLRVKMVEVGTSEDVVAQLVASNKDVKKASLKWFCTLCGIAAGLGAIGYFHLTDIYALMIMAFCLALGFLANFFLVGRLTK